jgi:hypothetical protein
MSDYPTTAEIRARVTEIREALATVPAPPWRWIGVRGSGGPQLVTDHSGRQYLLRAAKPTDDRGDELLDPETDAVIYGDLEFRDQRDGEKYSTMRSGNALATGRTPYDPDSIVGVDNPVAEWMGRSAQIVTDLLAFLDLYVGLEPTLREEELYVHEQEVRKRVAAEVHRADRPTFATDEDPARVAAAMRAIDVRLIQDGNDAPYWVPESEPTRVDRGPDRADRWDPAGASARNGGAS